MTPEEMINLERGDLVRLKGSGTSFVVTEQHGVRVTVVRTMEMSNPAEWEKVELKRKESSRGTKR
jgi:hypothetical protein